eukprot:scaffold44184_cov57-Phaeocystis_antarctica.AAC.3
MLSISTRRSELRMRMIEDESDFCSIAGRAVSVQTNGGWCGVSAFGALVLPGLGLGPCVLGPCRTGFPALKSLSRRMRRTENRTLLHWTVPKRSLSQTVSREEGRIPRDLENRAAVY